MRLLRSLPFVAVALLVCPVARGADPRRFALDDLDRIVRVGGAQISPDGTSVALVVARVNLAENRRDAQLLLVDVKTGTPRVLVGTKPGLDHPRFSPGGDRLAFLAEAESGQAQIHMLKLEGGDPR
ncbi:MAG TPA: hypothetical protein VMV21_05270, partial [Vicinamibacteria bacterium]|nr:hypothetical protein [Vicinamibacteria bacterium]